MLRIHEAGGLAFTMAKEMTARVGCKVAVPSDEDMERREILSEMRQTKHERSRVLCELHALFLKGGITTVVKKDLATGKKRDVAVKMLSGVLKERAEYEMKRVELLEEEIGRIEGMMEEKAKKDAVIQRLETIPGIGLQTAFAFTAHINVERFKNASQVSNYVGLVPRVDISSTIVKYGRITKRGNSYVRALLNQASWSLVRAKRGGALKERYEYMTKCQGKSKKKSIVAISRRLVEMMYTIVREKTEYEARKFPMEWPREKGKEQLAERLAAEAAGQAA